MEELADGAGDEQFEFVEPSQLEYIVQSYDVQLQRQGDILFANCTQEGAEVHDCTDSFVYYNLLQTFQIKYVSVDERSWYGKETVSTLV